jgi:hypothetical protein
MVSSTSTSVPTLLSIPVSEKLTWDNHHLWCAQDLPAIRAA